MKLDIAGARHRRAAGNVTFAGHIVRGRRSLLGTTALQAATIILLAIPGLAKAAPAPNTRPTGGSVVAGQASISQTPTQTTVAQSSQSAAVNWQSYSVGSNQTVAYQQPTTTSVTLNRVIGPDPSEIAGHITANGQIVIVNGSGVVFSKGSQVDAQSLVVSTANVSNADFMAGKMAFSQPGKPGAKISNAGTISVASTGLAALVAPQVANSGVINAKMGHVVLAGAEASTVDLYGDGLMSVDVTKQVTHTATGATALVTNTGTIIADGGTIQLTAQAADGIIQNLVSAGGKLQANSVNGKTGTIVVSGVGGSVTIAGEIKADGHGAGDSGGTIQVAATNAIAVQSTARISASGKGGGGTVAIGTTVQRAQNQGGGVPAGSAATVNVAAGARIAANGRGTGSGGSVAVLSNTGTTMAGSISARGGKSGGNGGNVEISSNTGLSITGTVNTLAPAGKTGTLLIDPDTLVISDAVMDSALNQNGTVVAQPTTGAQTISAATFNSFQTNVSLQATNSIMLGGGTALRNAGSIILTGTSATSTINVGVSLTAGGMLTLTGGTTGAGGVTIAAPVSGQGVVLSGSNITLTAAGSVSGGNLVSLAANTLSLAIGSTISTTSGTVAVAPLTAGRLTIDAMTQTGSLSLTPSDLAILSASATSLVLGQVAGTTTANSITFNTPLNLLSGTLTAFNLNSTGDITQPGGSLTLPTAASLTANAGGLLNLANAGNAISLLGPVTATQVAVQSSVPLSVTGAISAGTGEIALQTPSLAVNATLTGGRVDLATDALIATGSNLVAAATLAIAPATSGNSLTVGTAPMMSPVGLVLPTATIGQLLPTPGMTPLPTLELGRVRLPGSAGPFTTTAGTVTVNAAFMPNASTLGLYSTGDITATASVVVPTLTGSAGRTTTLTATGTKIDNLGNFSSTGGSFTLDNGANALSITGALSAMGKTVSLTTAGALSEAATGSITANMLTNALTGTTGTAILIPAAPSGGSPQGTNTINVLGSFTAPGGFSLADSASLIVNGPVSATSGAIVITAPTVTVAAVSAPSPTITGQSVSLTAVNSLVVNGTIGSCVVTNVSGSGATTLTATDPAGTILVDNGTVGGQANITLWAPGGVTVGTSAGDGGLVNGPAITTANGTGLSVVGAGQVVGGTVTLGGSTSVGGGTLYADTLNGQPLFTSGNLYGGTGLSVTLASSISGTISTQGKLSATSSGDVTTGAAGATPVNIYALGDAKISVLGSFNQYDGMIAAGGNLTISAGGVITQTPGASQTPQLIAGGTLLLSAFGMGSASIDGLVEAGTLQLVEPNAALSLAPTTLAGAGRVSVSVTQGSYVCPGCVTMGTGPFTVTASASVVPGSTGVRPVSLLVDGGSLTLNGALAADTVTLHSSGSTLQVDPSTTASVGPSSLTTETLTGTAGYGYTGYTLVAGLPSGLPVYDPSTMLAGSGSASLASRSASGATPQNNIQQVNGYQVAGDATGAGLTLVDLPNPQTDAMTGNTVGSNLLTLTGTIRAGAFPTASLANLTATLAGNDGATVTITSASDVALGTAMLPLSLIGSVVTLNTVGTHSTANASVGVSPGNLTESTGSVITAGTLTGLLTADPANASLPAAILTGANQVATLGNFTAPGGFTLVNARDLTVAGTVSALTSGSFATRPYGTVTITAEDGTGTPSATEPGLSGQVAGVGHLTIASTAVVTGGTVNLTGTDVVSNGMIGACELPGSTTGGQVTVTASGPGPLGAGTLAQITVDAGVIGGQTGVTFVAPQGVLVHGGIVDSGISDSNGVASVLGSVTIGTGLTQDGGSIFANTVSISGGVTLSGGRLHANHLVGSITFSGGDLYDGDSLSVGLGSVVTGQIATPATLTATGASSVSTSADFYAGQGATLSVMGDLTQTGGVIAAGTDLSILAQGVINQTGGKLQAGGTLLLSADGSASPASITGQLVGATIEVAEPNTTLTFAPMPLLGGGTVSVGLTNIPDCPACIGSGAGTSIVTATATALTNRPSGLVVDASTLSLGSAIQADRIELHSTGDTTQTAGGLTTSVLTGTAGFAYEAASYVAVATVPMAGQLPVYNAYMVTAGSGVAMLDARAPNGTPLNDISQISTYQVAGNSAQQGLTLSDAPTVQTSANGLSVGANQLTLSGTITAGSFATVTPGVAPAVTATQAGMTGADITVTVLGDLQLGGPGTPLALTGRTLTLDTGVTGLVDPAVGNLIQTAGSVITAASLSGVLLPNAGAATLPGATLPGMNQIATLASFAAPGGFALNDAHNLTITGTVAAQLNGAVTAQTGGIAITVVDGTNTPSATEAGGAGIGHLIVGPAALVTAQTVSLIGTDIVVNGQVGACELPDMTGGTISLVASGTPAGSTVGVVTPATIAVGGVVGGQVSATLTAVGGVTVEDGGTVPPGGLINAPTLTFGSTAAPTPLTVDGSQTAGDQPGVVFGNTVNASGLITLDGGTLHATTLTAPGGIIFNSGDLYAGNSLSLVAGPVLIGQIATGGTLTITGTSSVSDQAAIYAASNATVTLSGAPSSLSSFNEAAVTFAAGGYLTVVATGGITQAAGGSFRANDTLLLSASGGGSAAIAGQLSATTIDVVEPNLALSFAPTSLLGASTVQVGLSNSFECPGCTPPGVAASTVTAAATLGSLPPTVLRLDGSTLSLGSTIAATNIELHSLGNTSQPAGSLVTSLLTGTEGYAPSSYAPVNGSAVTIALPVYTPLAMAGVSGGTVMLTSATNAIAQVNGYQVRGDDTSRTGLVLTDATALTLTGTIAAGAANNPATATVGAEGLTGNTITLAVTGTGGNLAIGTSSQSASVLGNVITLNSSGTQSEAASSDLVASLLTGNASSAALPGPNQVATLASFTAPGGFQLTDTANLTIAGPVSAAAGAVVITAPAMVVSAGTAPATVTGANVTLTAVSSLVVNGTIGSCSLGDTTTGNIALAATAGPITVNTGAVIGGQSSATLSAGTVTQAGSSLIDGPAVTIAGNFNQVAGRVVGGSVNVTGVLTQTAGSIWSGAAFSANAPQVSGTIASGSNVTLTNVASVAGTITSDGSISITAPGSTPLSLSGTIVAAQTLSIVQGTQGVVGTGGGITQSTGILAAGGTATLYADGGAANETGGTLAAKSVQVVALAGDNNFTPSVQPILSGGVGLPVVYLCPGCTNSADPGSPGTLAASLGSVRPASVLLDGSTLTLSRTVAGDTVELHSTGATTVIGPISAGVLSGTAGYALTGFNGALPTYSATVPTAGSPGATFSNAGNAVQRLGPYQLPGLLTFTDAPGAPGLTIAGPVTTGSLTLTLTGAQGNLIIGDAVFPASILNGATVTLNTSGTITEAVGSAIGASTLTGSAGAVALPGPNQVTALAQFNAPGGFTLNDVSGLIVNGPFVGGPVALTVGGGLIIPAGDTLIGTSFTGMSTGLTSIAGSLLASGPIGLQSSGLSITGTVQSGGSSVALVSTGSLQQAGTLSAGTIIATSAAGATTFSGQTMAGQALVIGQTASVTLSGSETAPLIEVTAPAITLAGGTITVGGVAQPIGTRQSGLPNIATSVEGAFFEVGAAFNQTGTTTVATLAGAPNATFVVDLTQSSGTVTFGGLSAPTTNLILNLAASGSSSGGPLTLNNLFVTYTQPGGGSVDLTGTVDGKAGVVAAGASGIAPLANRDYRLNTCSISSVNCVILQPTLVPVGNPLKELTLNFFREQDDSGLLVPNITEQGL